MAQYRLNSHLHFTEKGKPLTNYVFAVNSFRNIGWLEVFSKMCCKQTHVRVVVVISFGNSSNNLTSELFFFVHLCLFWSLLPPGDVMKYISCT